MTEVSIQGASQSSFGGPFKMSSQSVYTLAELETRVSGPMLVTEKASSRYHRMKWGWNPQTVRGRSEGRVD